MINLGKLSLKAVNACNPEILRGFNCHSDGNSDYFYYFLNAPQTVLDQGKSTWTYVLVNYDTETGISDCVGFFSFKFKDYVKTVSMPAWLLGLREPVIRAWVSHFAISEDYRGQHLMGNLIKELFKKVLEVNPDTTFIQLQSTRMALNAYIHFGFREYNEIDLGDDPDKEEGMKVCAIMVDDLA